MNKLQKLRKEVIAKTKELQEVRNKFFKAETEDWKQRLEKYFGKWFWIPNRMGGKYVKVVAVEDHHVYATVFKPNNNVIGYGPDFWNKTSLDREDRAKLISKNMVEEAVVINELKKSFARIEKWMK